LCFVLVLAAFPVGAQESGGIPPGTAATGVDTDNTNSPPDLIEVAASDCTVSPGASITVEDGDGTRAVFTDQQLEITISAQDGSPTIMGPTSDYIGDHATFPDADTAFDTDGDYSVVSSTGVTCGSGGTTPADVQYKPGPVDNPKGVMPETVVVRKVPRTGGPPYIAMAAVALLSVALIAGRAILRP
jgi:hypothetical protein